MNTSKLHAIIEELSQHIPNKDLVKPKVSSSSVAWQISHSLKVMYLSLKAVETSDPSEYDAGFNLKKSLVLAIGYIPRGSVKAPKMVQPEEGEISESFLRESIEKIKQKIQKLPEISQEKSFMPHPLMGKLHRADTIRFLEVHTNHHLKIIREIVKK